MMIRIGRDGGRISKLHKLEPWKKFNLHIIQHTADLY